MSPVSPRVFLLVGAVLGDALSAYGGEKFLECVLVCGMLFLFRKCAALFLGVGDVFALPRFFVTAVVALADLAGLLN